MILPAQFVYLKDVDSTILQDVKYFTNDNFIGRPVKGYHAPRCILTQTAAEALTEVQRQLARQGLSLKVFDCYRPQTAVNDFIAWSEDISDQKMKKDYYPNIDKVNVFELGYIAKKSGHTRGSTVDLTIVDSSQQELEMGTRFDFLDELSHPLTKKVNAEAQKNRLLLRELMLAAGFYPALTEWWHFTLEQEPYPDTYFEFPVE